MFTARSVPNMYLFGTFSMLNRPKIAPLNATFPHGARGRGGLGK
jgi:hypothetical protein